MIVKMTSGDKTASYEYQVLSPSSTACSLLTYRSVEDVQVRIYNKSVSSERYGNFSLAPFYPMRHHIAAEQAEGGAIKLTRTTANAGEMVDVFANPDPNYHLKSLAYCTASGETVSIDNNRFRCPMRTSPL